MKVQKIGIKLIRYFSGFNLEGFLKGYCPEKRLFDKSIIKGAGQNHVWFFVKNNSFKKDSPALCAAKVSLTKWLRDYSFPDVTPCVFSGLIPTSEIEGNASKKPQVSVDKLYTAEIVKYGLKGKRKVDLSDLTADSAFALLRKPNYRLELLDISHQYINYL